MVDRLNGFFLGRKMILLVTLGLLALTSLLWIFNGQCLSDRRRWRTWREAVLAEILTFEAGLDEGKNKRVVECLRAGEWQEAAREAAERLKMSFSPILC